MHDTTYIYTCIYSVTVQEVLLCCHACSSSFHFTSLCIVSVNVLIQHSISECYSHSVIRLHVLALTTGGASPEDWRQVEDLFDMIRNFGESGGHT